MNPRVLKVAYLYATPYSTKPVPNIRLQGKWLENLGFVSGSKIKVVEKRGGLFITLLEDNSKEPGK